MLGKHHRAAFALVLGLALLPATLLGTSVVRLGTQDLLEMSPTIIMGEVLEQEIRLAEDGGYPITLTTIAIEESFKGTPRPVIEVFTLGGQVDDLFVYKIKPKLFYFDQNPGLCPGRPFYR